MTKKKENIPHRVTADANRMKAKLF